MIVEERIPLLETILTEWKKTIGNEYEGYKNHVYRQYLRQHLVPMLLRGDPYRI